MANKAGSREVRECASEIKFVVDGETADRVRERARGLLSADPHASGPAGDEYEITTIYFDTSDFDVFHRRGSYRRAKFRVRRYGEEDGVFLERKLRTSEMLTKRRTHVDLGELPRLVGSSPDRSWSGRWFHERLLMRRLRPVCQIAYRRTARVGETDAGPIRLTVDEGLHGWKTEGTAFDQPAHSRTLTPHRIVEMKFRGSMPAVFKGLVEEFALKPASMSKYRLGIAATRPEVAAPAPEGALRELDA